LEDAASAVPASRIDAEALKARYKEERDRRLRPDGSAQYISPTGQFAHYLDDPFVDAEPPRAPVTAEVEVALIGAGFGGMQAAISLLKAGIEDFLILDRAGDFGGVWYWNRYPGIACDVDSYIYMPLLEDMAYTPTAKYANGPEIFRYARDLAAKFDLYPRALLRTEIEALRWDGATSRWVITTGQGDVIRARFVNLATGPLQRPRLPGIPGIETFKGHSFHTSRWDYGYTGGDSTGGLVKLADKRVGIIGTGSSAVQSIPHLGRDAGRLYVFQRTPAPVPVRNNRPTDLDWAKSLKPGWQQHRMDNYNTLIAGGKVEEDLVADGWTEILHRVGIETDQMRDDAGRRQLIDFLFMEKLRRRVDEVVADKATAEALKPWYNANCKRPCFHDGYLETFNLPNVTLVDTKGRGVERITETAAVVDGRAYEIDCLIYATGFDFNNNDLANRNGFEIYGRDGRSLTEKWRAGIATLHGYTSRGFPNCVFQAGAQGLVTPNITHGLGVGGQHLAYLVKYCQDHQIRAFEPSEPAEREWADRVHSMTYRTKHDVECTPGYYNNDGKPSEGAGIGAFYPGPGHEFIATMEAWRAQGGLPGMDLSKGD
jgi:cyclohexanone monooxygenase